MKKIKYIAMLLCLLPYQVSASGVEHKLNVSIGMFDAAKVEMTYELTPRTYNFTSQVQTSGIFGNLYAFKARYNSSGIFDKQKMLTQNYDYVSETGNHKRTKKLVFDDKGILNHRLSSKDGESKRVEIILPDYPFDFADLQSVFASLAVQFQKNQFCAMEKVVFDGKKTSHIKVSDEGKVVLNDENLPFKGEAWKCSIYITRKNADDGDMLSSTTSDRPVYFWLMLDKTHNLPFLAKIEIESTPLGRLKAYTTDLTFKD